VFSQYTDEDGVMCTEMWFVGQFTLDVQELGFEIVPGRGKCKLKKPTSPGLVPAILISRRTAPGRADFTPKIKSVICAKPVSEVKIESLIEECYLNLKLLTNISRTADLNHRPRVFNI
jgi:hypothetical protein